MTMAFGLQSPSKLVSTSGHHCFKLISYGGGKAPVTRRGRLAEAERPNSCCFLGSSKVDRLNPRDGYRLPSTSPYTSNSGARNQDSLGIECSRKYRATSSLFVVLLRYSKIKSASSSSYVSFTRYPLMERKVRELPAAHLLFASKNG